MRRSISLARTYIGIQIGNVSPPLQFTAANAARPRHHLILIILLNLLLSSIFFFFFFLVLILVFIVAASIRFLITIGPQLPLPQPPHPHPSDHKRIHHKPKQSVPASIQTLSMTSQIDKHYTADSSHASLPENSLRVLSHHISNTDSPRPIRSTSSPPHRRTVHTYSSSNFSSTPQHLSSSSSATYSNLEGHRGVFSTYGKSMALPRSNGSQTTLECG